jgi:hypothetical protein
MISPARRFVSCAARRAVIIAAVLASCVTLPAMAQSCTPDLAGGRRVESAAHTLVWRTLPEPIAVGQHFSVELIVCPRTEGAATQVVRVDATMPEHRHGMNYRATIQPLGSGRHRADGLMFHMPGRWEMVFEVRGPRGVDLLRQRIDLD